MKKLTRYTQPFALVCSLLLNILVSGFVMATVNTDVNNQAHANKQVRANKQVSKSQAIGLHQDWNTLLSHHVTPINQGHSSAVDYAAIQQQRATLASYLKQLSQITQAEFAAWDNASQLAFLINAYNAWTVELILTKYPDIDSIKELGGLFSSAWDKSFISLLGKTLSLNDIEHTLIRGREGYNDPRIHFALNCASIGCPALREEAYTGAMLEQQLAQQTQRFLADSSRNYVKGDTVYLSAIFKWYGDDFTKGFAGANSVDEFLLLYPAAIKLNSRQQTQAQQRQLEIKFLTYDWSLNAVH